MFGADDPFSAANGEAGAVGYEFNELRRASSSFSETKRFCFEIFLGGGLGLTYSVDSDFTEPTTRRAEPGFGESVGVSILDPFGVPGLLGGFGLFARTSAMTGFGEASGELSNVFVGSDFANGFCFSSSPAFC